MVSDADYTVLCCFVFPLGFAIPTLLAWSEGERACCGLLRHTGCQEGWQCRGSGGKLRYPARGGEGGIRSPNPLPAACCILLFWEADGFLLVMENFPHGKYWAHWEAPGNLEAKTGEAREQD